MTKFFDTCSLLDLQQAIFESNFIISSITLTELESIKSSYTKDEETKWSARQILHLLKENENKYDVVIYNTNTDDEIIKSYGLLNNDDSRIIASAYRYYRADNNIIFCTADLACYTIAKSIGLPAEFTDLTYCDDGYSGYYQIYLQDNDLAYFYNKIVPDKENPYELEKNEYLFITDKSGIIIDKYKWTDEGYIPLQYKVAESNMFGKISPKDEYQQAALDSLSTNQITMLRGAAGTGKSYLAFGQMFKMLDEGKIDKIIVFCNTVATKGSAKLGFYPGSRTEKLLDSQIGNLLESKLGDRIAVERMITDGELVLLPMSDIRGYDTTGMRAAIYISEAQNLDIELMRLALQRVGEDSICIIDGDFTHQVDMSMYGGSHNGMRRVSQVFRGQPFYGEVELKNIYRSKIAQVAELM